MVYRMVYMTVNTTSVMVRPVTVIPLMAHFCTFLLETCSILSPHLLFLMYVHSILHHLHTPRLQNYLLPSCRKLIGILSFLNAYTTQWQLMLPVPFR